MKSIILTIASIVAVSAISAQEQMKFSISGNIEGAQQGDTLRFVNVSPDRSQDTTAFDIVVGRSGKVKYKGAHPHSQNYNYKYYPRNTTFKVYSSKLSCSLFITSGKIEIEAERDNIYLPTLKGGVYDAELQTIMAKENGVYRERDVIYKRLRSIDRIANPELSKQYSEEFNTFYSQGHIRERREEIKELMSRYINNVSNEYVAYKLLTSASSSMPLDSLETYYDKQSESVKGSYYGVELDGLIKKLKALAPNMPAPDFALTTTSGEVVTNKSLLGKYLLIYNYGLCPGSISLDKRLSDWYKSHKDRVEVIGYTTMREAIVRLAKNVKPGDKTMGIDMYVATQSMINHPWKYEVDGDFNDENKALDKIYDIRGLPFFIFISPEGKIIDRGFKTFYNGSLKVVDK